MISVTKGIPLSGLCTVNTIIHSFAVIHVIILVTCDTDASREIRNTTGVLRIFTILIFGLRDLA